MTYSAAVGAREFILNGVKSVPKCANPGTLVVFEPHAYGILTGKSKSSLLFAAAEYGKGRIFAVGHESYLDNFGKHPDYFEPLWSNIKRWLTHDDVNRVATISDDEIVNIEQFESVGDIPAHVKVVKWIGTVNKTELFINQLLKKFVTNGGAVLCGVCPWGWLNISHGKILDDMSLNKFLCLVGMCFSPDLCDFEGASSIKVEQNQAYKSHLGHAISTLASDMNEIKNVEDILVKAIYCLPANEAAKHLEKLIKVLYSYISIKYKPSSQTPVSCPTGRALLSLASKVYLKFTLCSIRVKAPNIDEFPGSIMNIPTTTTTNQQVVPQHNPNQLFTKIIEIKSKFDEFHCTGCYLAASGCAQITVVEGNPAGWEVRVGAHTDDLTTMEEIRRWPQLSVAMKLKKTMSLTSAFGGLIYLESPKGNSSIRVKIESVLEAPYFDLNRPETMSVWPVNRKAPGLWAELSGKFITFVVPSSSIRNLHNPEEALKTWDSIIAASHELRGTNPASTWRERVVVDIQPYGNAIHSGYPVVVSYESVFHNGNLILFSPKDICQRGWNIIHELAHNMQRSAWTPSGSEEITVNIFTLYAYESVFKEKAWTNRFYKERLPTSSLKKFTFEHDDWCENPYIGLCIYNQLVRAFGWNSFKMIFCDYETLNESERAAVFKSESHKWSEWISRYSSIVGLNVAPLFYFWAIPFVDSDVKNQVSLPAWLPNDDIIDMFPQRVELVKKKYENLLIGDEALYATCCSSADLDVDDNETK